jgi:4-hydroxy-3-polyprenylbenzoate decarboxylase
MTTPAAEDGQDFQHFLARYRAEHADDVLVVAEAVNADQDLTAIAMQLAASGRQPLIVAEQVVPIAGSGARHQPLRVATNVFGSRQRIGRLLGVEPAAIHAAYQERARRRPGMAESETGPILESVQQHGIDLGALPMLRHFESDRAPYITNAIVVAEHPDTGVGNLSYHRSMLHSPTEIATSLHSRGDLWRLLQLAGERGRPMPIAMVIGAHPLFMLAASARVPFGTDEREVAAGMFGAPLQVVRTPRYGIRVPRAAEIVLEGVIDPAAHADEGPFGEFTGYSSNRSTNNLFRVETVMQKKDAMLVDVLGGSSSEHLNLGRIPRESEMAQKLRERFPGVTALHYPSSGTHFHAYVALRQLRTGEARQVMLGLLGWDPYLKTVIAVDADVDVTRDEEVLWALATHFQPARDIVVVDGLPGSALDPSASASGTTSRMGLDATRGPGFDAVRATVAPAAAERARALLARLGRRLG